ncbi:MAG TPA: hypothetical protein G4O04_09115 [Anaerolineae bacterium]|nr:hypothetical protein [Anaerolineae bacterium]HIQ09654.1 hypothetical protein [Anaerolineaceae bacterium]
MSQLSQDTQPLFCAYHPDREASLRCNRCGKPICTSCAVHTPTGYRCPDCVRELRRRFDNARWYDYPLALGVGVVLSYLGSLLAAMLGFWLIFLAPVYGGFIAEAVRFVVRRRRSRALFWLAAASVVLGALPLSLPALLTGVVGLAHGSFAAFLPVVWQAAYLFLVTPGVYYRLSGIMV